MPEKIVQGVAGQEVFAVTGKPSVVEGSLGLDTQLPGQATTTSGLAEASGGMGVGSLMQPDIDAEILAFKKEETPLLTLFLMGKKVPVDSPEVLHAMYDQPRSTLTVATTLPKSSTAQAVLPLEVGDQRIPRTYDTLLVQGVAGYDETGKKRTPGRPLLLFVAGTDTATGNPIVRALNGERANVGDEVCIIPEIPQGTKISRLANTLGETQKFVPPSSFIPRLFSVFLQKTGVTNIVSDYFDKQKKMLPFTQAMQAEAALTEYKLMKNKTFWASRKAKFKTHDDVMGTMVNYTSEGIRFQFTRELQHKGKWTIEEVVGLMKMFYTGEDTPKNCIILCGRGFLEGIQNIDYRNHPEVSLTVKEGVAGWTVTVLHTVFGDAELKHDTTIDSLGWENSAAVLSYDRLVLYQFTPEHQYNEKVEGHEATRDGIINWDAPALKGACHIWIDGEGDTPNSNATSIVMWNSSEAPKNGDLVDGRVYYLLQDCPSIHATAKMGSSWKYSGSAWKEFLGDVIAD